MSVLMQNGLELALYGMGTVFVFLTLLVLATMLMSRIILARSEFPAEAAPAVARDAHADRRLVAVIGAAIERYRADNEQ